MRISEYKKMANLEDSYWWHVGRKIIVNKQLANNRLSNLKILNVGVGTGGTVKMLERFGEVYNVDTSDQAIQFSKQRGIKNIQKVSGIKLPFKTNYFDMVIALDVLEHIKEDGSALTEWLRVLKPNGKLIITVPAHQWLWSEHDESLHHFRRYTLSELHRKCNEVGLVVNKRSYIIVFSFPLIVLYRFIKSIGQNSKASKTSYVIMPKPINGFFIKLLSIEGTLLKRVNFPVGTSIYMESTKCE